MLIYLLPSTSSSSSSLLLYEFSILYCYILVAMSSVYEESEGVTATSQNTTHAQHGSCAVCAKAKSKCVRRSESSNCERLVTTA